MSHSEISRIIDTFDINEPIWVGDVAIKTNPLQKTRVFGPCAVESPEQMEASAQLAVDNNAHILRGGAWKPRSSPEAFQGLGEKGVELLVQAGKATNRPIMTEVMTREHLEILQRVAEKEGVPYGAWIGSRNMQNTELLKALGETQVPTMIKNAYGCTLKEWLNAVKYVNAGGNKNIFLCERGIRTTRNGDSGRFTPDIVSILSLKRMYDHNIPVFVDSSHAAGDQLLVIELGIAGLVAGADGIIVEAHPWPEKALCDGNQALDSETLPILDEYIARIEPILTQMDQRLENHFKKK